ncbi:unknown [Clostridium sp. CAG:780]|nr:unknown [Clostridium sp. CAG:780]
MGNKSTKDWGNIMRKILKYLLLVLIFSFMILFFNQLTAKATTLKTVNTMDELKKVFEEKAIIEGNVIKLTDNVVIEDNAYDIKIPELIIDFNGKTIECKETIYCCNKVTLEDNSTTNKLNWGGIIFNTNNSVDVREGAELTINNGKYIDSEKDKSYLLFVEGKMTVNDAVFSTNKTTDVMFKNTMINLGNNCEVLINNGDFSHVGKIIDDSTESNPYKHNYKLTINGGNFKISGKMGDCIGISALYPYVNDNNTKEVIIPKVILSNCNVESESVTVSFTGGSTEKEYKDIDTKILTILSGNYKCVKNGITALHISCNLSPFTYFNPKDVNIQNGTFSSEDAGAAIRLDGPRKRRLCFFE